MDRMSLSEQITYSTVLIKCIYTDGSVGTGTGFIVHLCKNDKHCIPVIVTNHHVVENSIKTVFEICLRKDDGFPNDKETITIDISGNVWQHHPNSDVDLVCLPIAMILNNIKQDLFYIPLTTDLIPNKNQIAKLSAMENIVMVGYPRGISDEYNHKPIIRKGITATHIKHDYQGKKVFLVDMACFPGSSGSPIFILDEGIYKNSDGHPCIGDKLFFVGILFQGPQYTAEGTLVFSDIPNVPKPATEIPMNLGEAIKAEEILAFEQLLSQNFNKENTNG